jgi:mercuric reductase
LPREEPEIGEELTNLLLAEGIDLRLGTSVERVSPAGDGVLVEGAGPSGAASVEAARLLVATGRRPNSDGMGLEEAGVRLDADGSTVVDDFFQTALPGVYAAGDVIGNHLGAQAATPVGAHDGAVIAQNLFGQGPARKADHSVIPRTIFTDPQVATVGLTDKEANRRGYVCSCSAVKMEHVPRAGAVRDTRGVIKMVIEAESHKVLGVHVLGLNAGEIIHEAAMGLRLGATNDDFIDMVHVYPTMAEALKLVALSFYKDISTLSCCAE